MVMTSARACTQQARACTQQAGHQRLLNVLAAQASAACCYGYLQEVTLCLAVERCMADPLFPSQLSCSLCVSWSALQVASGGS